MQLHGLQANSSSSLLSAGSSLDSDFQSTSAMTLIRKPIYYLLNGSLFSVAGKSYFRNYGVTLIACISALWKTAIAMTIVPKKAWKKSVP